MASEIITEVDVAELGEFLQAMLTVNPNAELGDLFDVLNKAKDKVLAGEEVEVTIVIMG